jgi:hypothetical protein
MSGYSVSFTVGKPLPFAARAQQPAMPAASGRCMRRREFISLLGGVAALGATEQVDPEGTSTRAAERNNRYALKRANSSLSSMLRPHAFLDLPLSPMLLAR